jgi:hypothetical protein
MSITSINSELGRRNDRRGLTHRQHKLPLCTSTGLARYRDRHQARDGVRAHAHGSGNQVQPFACPDCHGFHLEPTYTRATLPTPSIATPTDAFTTTLDSRRRRYFLVDVENATHGAKATRVQLAGLWSVITSQAPGVAPHDHVVLGAARGVARKYRGAISAPNVKWVIGADAPDGADQALLAAIDLNQVARRYDELVIFSGDHAFASLARAAKAAGLTVHVITTEHPEMRSMLSRELSAAADTKTLVRLASRANHAGIVPLSSGRLRSGIRSLHATAA